MRTFWHIMFGCSGGDVKSEGDLLRCVVCGGSWWRDEQGRWVNHEEKPWEVLVYGV